MSWETDYSTTLPALDGDTIRTAARTAAELCPASMTGPHVPEPIGKWGPSSKCANDPEVDTEWFFPRSYGTPRTPSDHGMWGGMTPDERRELRKAARLGRKPQSPVYRKLADCGTDAAYRRHKRRGEPVDDACLAAHNKQNAKYPNKDKKWRARA